MTEQQDWKPSDTRLSQWSQDEWDHRYFLWLQGPKPLPALPDPATVEPRHMPMFQVLVCLHGFDERRRKDALDGKFDDLDEAEAYDYRYEDLGLTQDEKVKSYRNVIRSMLLAKLSDADIDDQMINDWSDQLGAFQPYSGPRA